MKPEIVFLHKLSLAIRDRYLSDLEIAITNLLINEPNITYLDMAEKITYSHQHCQGTASALYQLLHDWTGCRVTKVNFVASLALALHEDRLAAYTTFPCSKPLFPCLRYINS